MMSRQKSPVSGDLNVDELVLFIRRSSVRKFVFLGCFFVIFLMIQLYIILVTYIPDAVGIHEEILSKPELSRLHDLFEKIVGFFMVWPVLFFSALVSHILNVIKLRKIVAKLIGNQ